MLLLFFPHSYCLFHPNMLNLYSSAVAENGKVHFKGDYKDTVS
jgi:hypothetical protein